MTADTDLGISLSCGRVKLSNSGQMNVFGKQLNRVKLQTRVNEFNSFDNDRIPFLDQYIGKQEEDRNDAEFQYKPSDRCTYIESEPRNPSQ
jgi:hypothetical protein